MKPIIQFDDFEKLDLRVGKVVSAIMPEWSEKLIEYKKTTGSLSNFPGSKDITNLE